MTSRPSVGPDDGLSVSASVNIRFHLAEFPDMDTLAVFTVDGTLHVAEQWYREVATCGTIDEVTNWIALQLLDVQASCFEAEAEALEDIGCPLVWGVWYPEKEPSHSLEPARLGWLNRQAAAVESPIGLVVRDLRSARRGTDVVVEGIRADPDGLTSADAIRAIVDESKGLLDELDVIINS